MKKFLGYTFTWLFMLLIPISLCVWGTTSYTTRVGIPKPADSDTGWGTTLRAGYDIIDSSFSVLSATETHTGGLTVTSGTVTTLRSSQVLVATSAYSGTEALSVNGSVKFFGPLGGSLSICDQNGINCVNLTNSVGLSLSSATITLLTASTITAVTSATVSALSVSSLTPTNIIGVTNGANATTGSYAEYTSSYTSNRSGYATSAWKNLSQIILTPGDWDITGSALCTSASNIQEIEYAVSSNSGTTTTDHVAGHNEIWVVNASTSSVAIPNYRQNITSNTTYYLKNIIYFSAGAPACNGRISARRER